MQVCGSLLKILGVKQRLSECDSAGLSFKASLWRVTGKGGEPLKGVSVGGRKLTDSFQEGLSPNIRAGFVRSLLFCF